MPGFHGLSPWRSPARTVPEYPWPSNDRRPGAARPAGARAAGAVVDQVTSSVAQRFDVSGDTDALRAEIRRLVASELSQLLKG